MTALQTWLQSRHLETIVLEIFDAKTSELVGAGISMLPTARAAVMVVGRPHAEEIDETAEGPSLLVRSHPWGAASVVFRYFVRVRGLFLPTLDAALTKCVWFWG